MRLMFVVCAATRVGGWRLGGAARSRLAPLRSAAGEAAAGTYSSTFVKEFVERGYMAQCTDIELLDERMKAGGVKAYLGFDATADSLHVGSLLQIMILRLLQRTGHKPLVLVGGGTTKIGDPSGKDESRKMLDEATIAANIRGISAVFEKFLTFDDDSATGAKIVNNADWLDEINYVAFLRDYGSQFSVNRMLSFDSVKTRLAREQPLSFLEFNYMILQAYDFLELARREGVSLQLGGSDQWGNIISGVELTRKCAGEKVVGLTAPLIATADGRKMGKTADGAVWLSADRLSPYEYWQFWRNVADADVVRFLKLFTELPLEKVADLTDGVDGAGLNAVKRVLADEATAMLHGADALPGIHSAVDALFAQTDGNNNAASDASMPRLSVSTGDFGDGKTMAVVDLLILCDFAKSKGEARRLIQGGGARVDDVQVADIDAFVEQKALLDGGQVKISAGKKRHAILELADS